MARLMVSTGLYRGPVLRLLDEHLSASLCSHPPTEAALDR